MKIRIGIVGATGYTGGQLLSLLANHNEAELLGVTSQNFSGAKIQDVFPHLNGFIDMRCESITAIDKLASRVDMLFCCLPNGSAMALIKKLINGKTKVIDFSSDFRLDNGDRYKQLYGYDHKSLDLIKDFVYGLPELNRAEIREAQMVANPGCYATGAVLSLAPLSGILEGSEEVIIDIKSPISGGGRASRLSNHFTETNQNLVFESLDNNLQKYEIIQAVERFSSVNKKVVLVNSKTPIDRGIMISSYIRINGELKRDDIYGIYNNYYENSPFVRVYGERMPEIKSIRNSNFCDIGFEIQDSFLVVVSVLDNLVKGASGQAVQNMNIMFGLDESRGLDFLPLFP